MSEEDKSENDEVDAKEKEDQNNEKKEINLDDFKEVANLIYKSENIDDIKPHIVSHLKKILNNSTVSSKYLILFLYDPFNDIMPYTADRIYNALPKETNQNILLIINSPGGRIEPAYLISKCCKEYSKKFVVSIPRKAKSAATLISLGADEIHMGIMSELGPIDPQFGGLPALGLSSAVEYLASLCKRYPESSDMFAKYLSLTLDLRTLGYFERVSESAMQYAQRLLHGKNLPESQNAYNVSASFVYTYKDHSFVIDKDEAKSFLGDIIKSETDEYLLGNQVHNFLEKVNLCADIFKQHFLSVVGTPEDLIFSEKKP